MIFSITAANGKAVESVFREDSIVRNENSVRPGKCCAKKARRVCMDLKIGVQIAKLRKEQEITQTALAEYLSVSPQAVSRWENGISVPDVGLFPQIAAFFHVSIDELFGVTDYEKIVFLVTKYSSDRSDLNYQEAMRYLNMELKEDDGNLKLLALKLHMLLQRAPCSTPAALRSKHRSCSRPPH